MPDTTLGRRALTLTAALAAACGSSADAPDAGARPDAARAADASGPADDAGPVDPSGLAALSDTFEGTALAAAWTVLGADQVMVEVRGGALVLTLLRHALWFQAERGVQVSRPVSGDFKATVAVHARRRSNPALPPDRYVHLAGLMARDGRATDGESYTFAVVGFDEVDVSVETKSTHRSVSNYEGPAWPSGDAELRLCRQGSAVHLYKRAVGAGAWTLAKTYERPDFGSTLEVGPVIYGIDRGQGVDLVATFDEVRFEAVGAGCDR